MRVVAGRCACACRVFVRAPVSPGSSLLSRLGIPTCFLLRWAEGRFLGVDHGVDSRQHTAPSPSASASGKTENPKALTPNWPLVIRFCQPLTGRPADCQPGASTPPKAQTLAQTPNPRLHIKHFLCIWSWVLGEAYETTSMAGWCYKIAN